MVYLEVPTIEFKHPDDQPKLADINLSVALKYPQRNILYYLCPLLLLPTQIIYPCNSSLMNWLLSLCQFQRLILNNIAVFVLFVTISGHLVQIYAQTFRLCFPEGA